MAYMDMKLLTILVDIIDAGNLSEAARRLNMTRANVSYHLGQLEKSVGAQLVRRTTRRVEPTELGLMLYRHGIRLRQELAAARESVESLSRLPKGKVRLSVPSGYGKFVMTPWLLEFKRSYPDIVLEVRFENAVDDLLRKEIDIAIRILPSPPENLVARQMGRVRYLACVSAQYAEQNALPEQPGDLSSAPVITAVATSADLQPGVSHGGNFPLSGVQGRGLQLFAEKEGQNEVVLLHPTVISRDFPFLRDATLDGLGVGLLPDYMVRGDIAHGRLLTALDAWQLNIYGHNMYMLYMPDRHRSRALSILTAFIMEKVQADGLLNTGS